jgi:hypothetical protein
MTHPRPFDAGTGAPETERRAPKRAAFAAALDECRASLLAPDGDSPESQRRFMRAFAETVRRLEVPPERFLAAFKKMAINAPTIARLPADERMEAMHRLTTIAIATYYQADGLDGSGEQSRTR